MIQYLCRSALCAYITGLEKTLEVSIRDAEPNDIGTNAVRRELNIAKAELEMVDIELSLFEDEE